MARQLITRSDGKTVDLDLQAAEQANLPAKAKRATLVDSTGNLITNLNPLPTTATISGDVNVDVATTDSGCVIGKSSGGDFTTAYASGTTITCSSLPAYHSTLIGQDLVIVVQINSSGTVVNTYTRDDTTMTVAGNVVSVTGATFAASDTFIIYTNVARQADYEIGAVEIKNDASDDRVTVIKPGTQGAILNEKLPLALRVDDYTTANATYIGKAAMGSLTSSAVWQIKKIDTATGVIITWADGDALFNNIWDNRATTVVYS